MRIFFQEKRYTRIYYFPTPTNWRLHSLYSLNSETLPPPHRRSAAAFRTWPSAVVFIEMASSSIFSASTLNGSVLAPKASKSNVEFICNYSNDSFKPTYNSLSHSRAFPNAKQRNSSLCRALDVESKPFFPVGNKFQFEDIIEAQQFDRDTLGSIFDMAMEMEKIEKNSNGGKLLQGYLMATLFYEPSTRTRLSFESAMKRLGGEVLTTENAREFSSAAKGETLEGSRLV